MIEHRKFITRAMLKAEPDALFVFGDNFERRGYGGQAKEMRGEPNSVGIATKKNPSMRPSAFFSNDDIDRWHWHSLDAIERLQAHTGLIVWPTDGIGTGLARLDKHAPMIYAKIISLLDSLYLPVDYTKINTQERKSVREQYIKKQNNVCIFCNAGLDDHPSWDVRNKTIDLSLFPTNFLRWPIHLDHDHETGMTRGAIHSYCNAVQFQYYGK